MKGYLPTIGFPWLWNRFVGSPPVDLPVLLALAAILGHTFPIYLGFRGGKGVATSLGGVLALDPISCGFAALAFAIFVGITRYVSLSALLAGVVFVATHFLREPDPLNRNHIAMTLFSIAVLILLFVRHRSNLARIWAGSESRVSFNRKRNPPGNGQPPSSGKISVMLLASLALFAVLAVAGIWLYRHAHSPSKPPQAPGVCVRSIALLPASSVSIASSSPGAETASPHSAQDMIGWSSTT